MTVDILERVYAHKSGDEVYLLMMIVWVSECVLSFVSARLLYRRFRLLAVLDPYSPFDMTQYGLMAEQISRMCFIFNECNIPPVLGYLLFRSVKGIFFYSTRFA